MADLQSKPIVNLMPGETSDFTAGMKALLHLHALDTRKLIPAKVMQFDRVKNMATVQPMVMLVDVSDNTRIRKAIANIPVISLGGGGFHINFPLKEGDLGWILAADRDISQFMQNLKAAPPNTFRKHTFSDGWFIPDVFRQYTINSADSAAMVIQSTDGATRISIGQGTVNITAPTSVTVTTPLATFSQDVAVNGKLTVTGLTTVNGGFTALGTGGNQPCTLPQSTTIGGIAVYGHGHISSNPGTRTSGGMIA
jgi:phage baseplate assembly protein gpV